MGKNIADHKFVDFNLRAYEDNDRCKEIEDELNILVTEDELLTISTLNADKRAILAAVRSRGLVVLPTATSRVASFNLPYARTTQSRFRIPINIDKNTCCNVSKQSGLDKLLRVANVIIWDEATMAKKITVEALDLLLKDINDCDLPFGGKVIVFGGDFRQVLPVVLNATKEEHIDTSLVTSHLRKKQKKIHLTENMRAKDDPSFCEYLLRVVNGEEKTISDDIIQLPPLITIPYLDDTSSLNALIEYVFPKICDSNFSSDEVVTRTILTPKNDDVDYINDLLINKFIRES
ncbi:uncharacterized protein LOC141631736 [Silene latifolia]|uniref:uncharacterized protein LOC141631736 n=1 Tax=Silene latifolia TaxID=37657 RepID=UPI003D77A7A9